MARYKKYSYEQGQFIAVNFHDQIVPGSFEYALNYIVDNELDLSVFEDHYKNDETGAPAFEPAIMLKIVLYAYSLGIISSRQIARCCETNIVFMALSAHTQAHFTTIAEFISSMGEDVGSLFRDILLICAEENLIGKQMFAIDGCKLSSNCAKEWSGTKRDFLKKKEKIEKSIDFIIRKHKAQDKRDHGSSLMIEKEKKALKNLKAKAEKIQRWLDENEDKKGKNGKIIQSNITDNESGKMPSSHGMIQGYNALAITDDKHQIIVNAETVGSVSEKDMLKPMIDGARENFEFIGEQEEVFEDVVLTADSGFHSEENLKMLGEAGIDAYIADKDHRRRDPLFSTADRHNRPIDRHKTIRRPKYFQPKDFKLDPERNKLICPAGKELYLKNRNFKEWKGLKGMAFMGKKTDCRVCELRKKCLRKETTEARQVTIFYNRFTDRKESYTSRMIKAFDSVKGRFYYSRRMGAVEPVFANIRNNLGLDKFSLRSKKKVDIQWKLYCMVHNIGKIYRYAYQAA